VRRLLCWFMHVSTNYKFHSERKHFLKFWRFSYGLLICCSSSQLSPTNRL
jgi:hypothetical protein